MATFGRALPHERDEIIDLANYVFSQSARPHDFKRLIPKAYADDAPCCTDFHFVARDQGRIRGIVAILPIPLVVAGHSLTAGYVGTVCVHGYDRGSGYMKALMPMALADAAYQGMAYCALGGARQRYEYFGFSPAGVHAEHLFNADNIRHGLAGLDAEEWRFEPIVSEADPWLEQAFALYEAQPVHGARPRARFRTICESWGACLYAVLRRGVFRGMLIGGGDNVSELLLTEEADLAAVLKAWQLYRKAKRFALSLPVYAQGLHQRAGALAEDVQISYTTKLCVFKWRETLEAYLALRHTYAPLSDGCLTLRVDEAEPFTIRVERGVLTVAEEGLAPDVSMGRMQAQALFFSPLEWIAPSVPLPAGWFPLALDLPEADRF